MNVVTVVAVYDIQAKMLYTLRMLQSMQPTLPILIHSMHQSSVATVHTKSSFAVVYTKETIAKVREKLLIAPV